MRGLAVCVWWCTVACGRVGFDALAGTGGSDGAVTTCAGPIATTFDSPLPPALTPYGVPPGAVQAADGLLVVSIDGVLDNSAGIRTSATSLIDRSVAVEVAETIDSQSSGVTFLGINDASDMGDLFVYSQSDLLRVERIIPPDSFEFVAELPLDLVAQRWWRIGATTTQFLVDISPDGVAWSRVVAVPAFIDPGQIAIEIGAGSFDIDIPADTARFATVLDCSP